MFSDASPLLIQYLTRANVRDRVVTDDSNEHLEHSLVREELLGDGRVARQPVDEVECALPRLQAALIRAGQHVAPVAQRRGHFAGAARQFAEHWRAVHVAHAQAAREIQRPARVTRNLRVQIM